MTPRRYELRVAGHLSDRARGAFAGMQVVPVEAETLIYGDVADDAALHGLLALCRTLGLEVVALHELPG